MILLISVSFYGCALDNYDPPTSFLQGAVVHENSPVGVRSGAARLELWQDGYETPEKIDVYIAQEGSFSARLFEGNYKLVRVGGAPWENNPDTINVKVEGTTVLDVPVIPYFTLTTSAESFQLRDGTITSSCLVSKVGSRDIESLTLYVGNTSIVDANNNTQAHTLNEGELTDLSAPIENSVVLNPQVNARGYAFVRIGVKAFGIPERIYSPVVKINLK